MVYILEQNQIVSENRSILLGALILVYMILFGHGLPNSINKNLYIYNFFIIFYLTTIHHLMNPYN